MVDLPDFLCTVENAWSGYIPGNPILVLSRKIKLVKGALRELNKKSGNVISNVAAARVLLSETQDKLNLDPTEELLGLEQAQISSLNGALITEEHFLLQKSRVKWLDKGDGNNGFFFSQCKANWNVNKVLALHDSDDHLVTGQKACADVAVAYFQSLLGGCSEHDLVDLSEIHCNIVTPAQASMLEAPVTNDLVLATIKSMKKNKAPGPDGVNAEFYLATWHITGDLFYNAVKHFFSTGQMPKGPNSSFISLVPKTNSPTSMRDLDQYPFVLFFINVCLRLLHLD